ncbi:MAG: hypothetical protein QXQ46_11000, partial [Thermoplasmatales archaeon]
MQIIIIVVAIAVLSSISVQQSQYERDTSTRIDLAVSPTDTLVTFAETGTTGKNWSVNFNTLNVTSSRDTISFFVPPGNYTYSITPPRGYASSVHNGTITVGNKSILIPIRFTMVSFFYFFETGLPSGTKWTVIINGTSYSSSRSSIVIKLPAGN